MNVSTVLKQNPLDNDLINNIVESIKKIVKTQDNIIDDNLDIANKNIPVMLLHSSPIFLNGKINNIPVKILFHTGATINCIHRSKMFEVGLDNFVDKRGKLQISGLNYCTEETNGQIWYTEIALDLNIKEIEQSSTTTAIIGLTLMVIDDNPSDTHLNLYDIILGTNFMKSYGANINFMTNIITLNKPNKKLIKFN